MLSDGKYRDGSESARCVDGSTVSCGFDPDLLCLPKRGAQVRSAPRFRVGRNCPARAFMIHSNDPYARHYGSNGACNPSGINSRIDLKACRSRHCDLLIMSHNNMFDEALIDKTAAVHYIVVQEMGT
jgi:hypothetical protein